MPGIGDFEVSFESMVGSLDPQDITYASGYETEIYGFEAWYDMFETTGIEYTTDAFENFLIAFYPQEGMSGDDWQYIREEFYGMYGIDDHNIDWEAYREAIGYGRY